MFFIKIFFCFLSFDDIKLFRLHLYGTHSKIASIINKMKIAVEPVQNVDKSVKHDPSEEAMIVSAVMSLCLLG